MDDQKTTLTRNDLFLNFINKKYGPYISHIFAYALSISVIIFGIFATLVLIFT